MYFYFVDGTRRLINFSHPDKPIDSIALLDIHLHPTSLVLYKKNLLYLGFNQGIDLLSFLHYTEDEVLDLTLMYPKTMEIIYQRNRKHSEVNKIVPLSKLIEFANNVWVAAMPYHSSYRLTDKCIKYCNDFVMAFHEIEKNDIHIDDGTKKQNYMWYTATSRPSNTWDNFNIAALNKTDGSRDRVHSKFEGGKLVQFDYDAFHLKLLANMLDYKFEKHPYIQIQDDLNLVIGYDEMKVQVFQNIYGRITPEFLEHPLFLQIQAVIDELYESYLEKGFIESWMYEKKFIGIDNPNPNKVFNYFIQSMETEYNLHTLRTLLPVLAGQKTVLSMYLYDAFVFDVPPDEFYLIPILKTVLESNGMTVKLSIGDTFGSMHENLDDIYTEEEQQ
jgi:hypothetical protein